MYIEKPLLGNQKDELSYNMRQNEIIYDIKINYISPPNQIVHAIISFLNVAVYQKEIKCLQSLGLFKNVIRICTISQITLFSPVICCPVCTLGTSFSIDQYIVKLHCERQG
jgi:hypothetical protein